MVCKISSPVFFVVAGPAEEEDDVWGAAPGQVWQHD